MAFKINKIIDLLRWFIGRDSRKKLSLKNAVEKEDDYPKRPASRNARLATTSRSKLSRWNRKGHTNRQPGTPSELERAEGVREG